MPKFLSTIHIANELNPRSLAGSEGNGKSVEARTSLADDSEVVAAPPLADFTSQSRRVHCTYPPRPACDHALHGMAKHMCLLQPLPLMHTTSDGTAIVALAIHNTIGGATTACKAAYRDHVSLACDTRGGSFTTLEPTEQLATMQLADGIKPGSMDVNEDPYWSTMLEARAPAAKTPWQLNLKDAWFGLLWRNASSLW